MQPVVVPMAKTVARLLAFAEPADEQTADPLYLAYLSHCALQNAGATGLDFRTDRMDHRERKQTYLSRRRVNRFFRLGKKLRVRSIALAGQFV